MKLSFVKILGGNIRKNIPPHFFYIFIHEKYCVVKNLIHCWGVQQPDINYNMEKKMQEQFIKGRIKTPDLITI